MRKILFLDHAPILGGAENALLNLIRLLDRTRYEPIVVTATSSALAPILTAEGIRTVTMPFVQVNVRRPAMLTRLIGSSLALGRIVHREQPDLVHSNTVRAHLVSALTARFTGVPLVWTMHDRTLPVLLFRLLSRFPQRIIFVSQFLSRFYGAISTGPPRFRVIPNGIRPTPMADASEARDVLGLPVDSPVIVNVGRLIEGKGQHIFLLAAAEIATRRPEAVFLLVGGANQDDSASARYAKRLKQMATSPPLAGRVILAGHQSDVSPYYDAADICVFTAVVEEGLPLAVLEAMAHGKPVIASNLGPAPELVQDRVTGRLVHPGDHDELAKAITDLLDHRRSLAQLGEAGRQRVIQDFDPREILIRTLAVYDEVMAEKWGTPCRL